MRTMGNMDPEVPRLSDLGGLARGYAEYILRPQYKASNDILQSYIDKDKEEQARKLEQERYDTELGFKTRAEERLIGKEKEEKEKVLATNNALATLLDPDKVTSLNTAAGDVTTQNQINMYNQANSDGIVTPQEQALIDARYKEDLSRDVLSNPFADQSSIINSKKSILDTKLKDPNSPEYQALEESLIKQKERELILRNKYDMAKLGAMQKMEDAKDNKFANYLKSIAENPTQVLVPGSTAQGVTNQGEIDNYVNNLTASSNQYNQIVKDFMDKRELELDLGYKPNPGSSVQIPVKKTISGKELEDYAHEQAFNQTFGNYDFSKAPQAQYGEVKVEDKYIPKTRDQLIEDRLRILMNSNLPASTLKSEYEKLVPTISGPKTQKEMLEIQKLEAEIEKRNAETKKVMAETGANKKGKDVPKNIGQTTANTIGASDAADLLSKIDTIAKSNNIPTAELYNIIEQANNRAIESGLFDNVSEDDHKNFIKNEIWRKYRIDLK